jgi:hypothetical protein
MYKRSSRYPDDMPAGPLTQVAQGALERRAASEPPREATPFFASRPVMIPPPAATPRSLRPVALSEPPPAPRKPKWKERSVFFVQRNGAFRVDWLLAATLVITGSLVGVAGRPLLDKTSESVAVARKWICPVNEAPPVAATMALGSVLIAATPPSEAPPASPKDAVEPTSTQEPTLITAGGPSSHAAAAKAAAGATGAAPRPKESTHSAAPASGGSLRSAMQSAAGITEAEANRPATTTETRGWDQQDDSPKAAEAASPSVPETPAVGALQAAVHPLSPAARACVRDYTESSHANIVFLSSGRVGDVNVSGPAAGTPAERCIRSAFMRASVAPFRKASYVVGVSVRP